jgi:hypothetical protein
MLLRAPLFIGFFTTLLQRSKSFLKGSVQLRLFPTVPSKAGMTSIALGREAHVRLQTEGIAISSVFMLWTPSYNSDRGWAGLKLTVR